MTKPTSMALEVITQSAFQRKRGIYITEMFTAPPMHRIEGLELPLGSVAHYIPEEDKDMSPDEAWWLIRGYPKQNSVWVEHLYDFKANHGKVKKVTGNPEAWARKFHMRHPDLKRVVNRKTALGVEANLLVINHALARHFYNYINNRFLGYQIAKNTRDNVIGEVAQMVKEIDRVHYIPIKMPSKLYELGKIKKAAAEGDDLQLESIRRFGTVEGLFFLDLWRFIANPDNSQLGSLIPKENWNRVNLLLTCNGSWFMLNLGLLGSWIKTEKNLDGKWDTERGQRIFLNNLIQLVEHAVTFAKKPEFVQGAPESSEATTSGDLTDSLIKEQVSSAMGSSVTTKIYGKENDLEEPKDGPSEKESLLTKGRLSTQKKEDQSKRYSLDSRVEEATGKQSKANPPNTSPAVVIVSNEEIDRNVEALEQVDVLIEEPEHVTVSPHLNPLEDGIRSRAHRLAKDGIISAAGLAQAEKLAVAYKSIPNPFGDGLAIEACQVTPEELTVKAKKVPTRSKRIFDESLMFSSIEDITTKYVRQTYKKDIINVALSIQKSGIGVTSIEADTVETISGSQLVVLIRTKGINGAQSTLPIVLPAFEDDGTYKSGGTRYRMKTQRVDAPIRKVRPSLVYLTSYHGKIGVMRSDKKVFAYDEWLRNTIAAMEMDGNALLQGSEHSNVFDPSLKMPYVYSVLSSRFKTLKLGDFVLLLDRKEVERTFSDLERRKLESSDHIIAGIDHYGKPVIMSYSGEITVAGKSRGRVEEILSIDVSAAPHEAAMISIRGQSIPLGVVIASYIGLSRMIDHLGGKVRRVQSGQRQELQWYESPIKFNDETLIVDTRDHKTSLLMMGFKQYAKQIRQLSVYGFDKSHSYHHLFDAGSRSSAMSVELELLDERFVDPMTERVLKDMKEPTTWQGLLWRSLELLTTNYSPDEMDGDLMMFKLHERINGMMYAELTKSIRKFKMDSRVAKASLDIKPTAVWQKITSDAAISPVNNCNPIADLRAQEGVTYIGHGGRSKRSMVARNRKFHENDSGNISLDTVDSGDTGINVYFSANPNVKTTAGRSKKGSQEETGISSMVSTSMLLGPCLDIDDQI